MSQTVLFAPIHGAALLEMLPIAEKLAEDGRYEPVFFIFREISFEHLDCLHELGIQMIGPKVERARHPQNQGDQIDSEKEIAKTFLVADQFKHWFKKLFSLKTFSFLWHLIHFGYQLIKAKRLLKVQSVVGVVTIGDRHVGWETAIIKAANQLHIPSLIVPFAMSAPKVVIEYRLRKSDSDKYYIRSVFDRLVSRFFSSWVYEFHKDKLFFIPPGIALAAQSWGLMPKNPWVLGGGEATCMAVESPAVKQMFFQQGISEAKMVVTGKPSLDRIHDIFQSQSIEKMRDTLDVDPGQPIILCSVPQLGEHGLLAWDAHWQEIDFLFSVLTSQNEAKVIFSLHPKSDPEAYRPYIQKCGGILARRRIYELLPLCDLFVSTYSSIVAQAIACGKPTIITDFYDLNFPFYTQEPGVFILHERKTLASTVEHLLTDTSFYEQLAHAQRHRGPEWALLDGQNTQRVVDLLFKLIEESNGE
jgi:hypothetical protein